MLRSALVINTYIYGDYVPRFKPAMLEFLGNRILIIDSRVIEEEIIISNVIKVIENVRNDCWLYNFDFI